MTAGSVGVLGFVAEDGLAGKLDFVAFLADALDHDLLAFFQLVTHVADAPVGDFRDVQQAISAGKISTKAPKSTMRLTVPT